MDFFDEDDPPSAPRSRRRPDREPEPAPDGDEFATSPRISSEQRLRRGRLRLLLVGVVGLILLFLLINSYLDSRRTRGFEDYVRDLSALATESDQLSESFFEALNGGGGDDEGEISLQNEVNGLRGQAEGLADRAAGLDAPDELSGAQGQIVLGFDLRDEALAQVAEELPAAQGRAGANKAVRNIAEQMRKLSASDVLYRRARGQIDDTLAEEEIFIDGGVAESEFVPTGNNDPDYLSDDGVEAVLSGSGSTNADGSTDPAEDGLVHGLGLTATTVGGVALSADASTSVPADGAELTVEVMNQGEAAESDVRVSVSGDFSGNQRISAIEPGATETVTIPLTPAPGAGETASIEVDVATVDGEQVADNNTATYEVSFE